MDGPPGTITATVLNSQAPTTVAELRILDDAATPPVFFITDDQCVGRFLDTGSACTVTFEHRPVTPGSSAIDYRIRWGQKETYTAVGRLRGYTPTGIPDLDLGGPQEFLVPSGQRQTRRIEIQNKGPVTLTLVGDFPAHDVFTVQASNCPNAPIAPSGVCFIELLIQPKQEGIYDWSVAFDTDSVYRPRLSVSLLLFAFDVPGQRRGF